MLDVRKSKVLHFNFFTIFLSKCCNNFTLSIFNHFFKRQTITYLDYAILYTRAFFLLCSTKILICFYCTSGYNIKWRDIRQYDCYIHLLNG